MAISCLELLDINQETVSNFEICCSLFTLQTPGLASGYVLGHRLSVLWTWSSVAFIATHLHTFYLLLTLQWWWIDSNLGFSVLPNDTQGLKGGRDWTTDLLIGKWLALFPEPHFSGFRIFPHPSDIYIVRNNHPETEDIWQRLIWPFYSPGGCMVCTLW